MLGQASPGSLWELITNLAVIIGYLSPFLVIGWVSRGWLSSHFASVEDLKELRQELEDFKRQLAHQDVADAARWEKLENNYEELLRLITTSRMRP